MCWPVSRGGRYDFSELGDLSGGIPDGPFYEVYDGPAAAVYAKFPGAGADEWYAAPGWEVVCGEPLKAVSMTRFGLAKTLRELLNQRRILFESPERLDRATHARLRTADRAVTSTQSHRLPFANGSGNTLKLALLDSLCVASLYHLHYLCPRFILVSALGQGISSAIYLLSRVGISLHMAYQ